MTCPHCHGSGYRHVWRTVGLSTHRERCALCGGLGWFECGGEG